MSGGELKRVKEQEKNLFGRWATGLSGDIGINQAKLIVFTQQYYKHIIFTTISHQY